MSTVVDFLRDRFIDNYPELSRFVNLDRLYKRHLTYSLHATAQECLALAQRFGIVAVQNLQANYTVEAGRTPYQGYYITLHLLADVVQNCVVSFAHVHQHIDNTFGLHILDQKYQHRPLEDPYEKEDVEYSCQGMVDLGEIAAQYLSLSLDSYTRAPQENLMQRQSKREEKAPRLNPFSILKSLE